MKIYKCESCHFLMGDGEFGPGVHKIRTSIGPEIRCGRCGCRVSECIIHTDEEERIKRFWERTKNDANELGVNVA